MLALSMRHGEWIYIGDVRVKFDRRRGDGVRILIDAPPDVRILRAKVMEKRDETHPAKSRD